MVLQYDESLSLLSSVNDCRVAIDCIVWKVRAFFTRGKSKSVLSLHKVLFLRVYKVGGSDLVPLGCGTRQKFDEFVARVRRGEHLLYQLGEL